MRVHIKVSIGLAVLGACVLPAVSQGSARNITHKGENLTKSVEAVGHGTASFTSEQGGLSCPVTQQVLLKPGSTGETKATGIANTSECVYSGSLDTLCGTVSSHASTGLPLIGHATKSEGKYTARVTNVHLHVDGTGIFCPTITLKGDIIGVADDPHNVTKFFVSGTMESNITEVVHISGTVNVTPASTYSFET